jgi:hypothetical protein
MASLVGAGERFLSLSHPVVLSQQHGKLERPVGIAARIGAGVCGCCALDVAPLVEEHSVVEGGAPVTALVCVL